MANYAEILIGRRYGQLGCVLEGGYRDVNISKMLTVTGCGVDAAYEFCRQHSDYFKSWVHSRLNWDQTQPGAWHLPEDATDDYCRQLVNESVIISPNGKRTWKEHGANHYLDCEMLNASAAYMLQVHRLRPKGAPEQAALGRRVISKGVEI